MEKKRSHYTTTIETGLMKRLKILSINLSKRHNDLLEEAIRDLLEKYAKNTPPEK
jgi:predicted DNA-binding protein